MKVLFASRAMGDIQEETVEIRDELQILFKSLSLGLNLKMPVARSISGFPGLRELRLRDAQGLVRVFYIQEKGHVFILHLFRKKTQKTPRREIETAIQRFRRLREEIYG